MKPGSETIVPEPASDSPFAQRLPEDVSQKMRGSHVHAAKLKSELVQRAEEKADGNPQTGVQIDKEIIRQIPELASSDVIERREVDKDAKRRRQAENQGSTPTGGPLGPQQLNISDQAPPHIVDEHPETRY